MTTTFRDDLRAMLLLRLDEMAVEHPAGHQGKLAARFLLWSKSGEGIELMFEKGPSSSPNLWILYDFVEPLLTRGIEHRLSTRLSLHADDKPGGKTTYGRHSALKSMRQLSDADLVCFKLSSINELNVILDWLQQQ